MCLILEIWQYFEFTDFSESSGSSDIQEDDNQLNEPIAIFDLGDPIIQDQVGDGCTVKGMLLLWPLLVLHTIHVTNLLSQVSATQ